MPLWKSSVFRWTLLLSFALAWRLILFVGAGAKESDSISYSESAHTLLVTHHLPPGIHGMRLGYIGIIAALYGLFGAGSFSLIAFNLLASLAEIVIAWHLAREFLDEKGAWLTALLLALFPLHIFHATEAHTDLPLAALTSLSLLLFLRARRQENPAALCLLSGICLGGAHLMKESAFLGLAVIGICGGWKRWKDVALVVMGFTAIAITESILFAVITGDPLYRFHTTLTLQQKDMYELYNVPMLQRLFLQLPAMLFWLGDADFPFFAGFPLIALAGAGMALLRRDKSLRVPMLWAIMLLALLNFWPLRLVPYCPALIGQPRVFLVIAVPLVILAASFLQRLPRRWAVSVFLLMATTAMLGAFLVREDARRLSLGARLAYEQTKDAPVIVSAPMTISLFRLYDGYEERRRLLDWTAVPPQPPYLRVVDEPSIRRWNDWYGVPPPPSFSQGKQELIFEQDVPGRLRLRPLLFGRVERETPLSLRIYKVRSEHPE